MLSHDSPELASLEPFHASTQQVPSTHITLRRLTFLEIVFYARRYQPLDHVKMSGITWGEKDDHGPAVTGFVVELLVSLRRVIDRESFDVDVEFACLREFDHLELKWTPETGHDAGINIGRISGGTRANVVAGAAEAEVGLRFSELATEQSLLDLFHGLRVHRDGVSLDIVTLSHRPAWPEDPYSGLTELVIATARAQGEEISARPTGGAGDTNFTGSKGIPTLDGLGPRVITLTPSASTCCYRRWDNGSLCWSNY
jgi:acetylornithine deacetylase/succinyl-diaminopimelate desuccinylase-like protein